MALIGRTGGRGGGASVSIPIVGAVANQAALPTGLTSADANKGWITSDTGVLWIWTGSAWADAGVVRGPKGDPGVTVVAGGPVSFVIRTAAQGKPTDAEAAAAGYPEGCLIFVDPA